MLGAITPTNPHEYTEMSRLADYFVVVGYDHEKESKFFNFEMLILFVFNGSIVVARKIYRHITCDNNGQFCSNQIDILNKCS